MYIYKGFEEGFAVFEDDGNEIVTINGNKEMEVPNKADRSEEGYETFDTL